MFSQQSGCSVISLSKPWQSVAQCAALNFSVSVGSSKRKGAPHIMRLFIRSLMLPSQPRPLLSSSRLIAKSPFAVLTFTTSPLLLFFFDSGRRYQYLANFTLHCKFLARSSPIMSCTGGSVDFTKTRRVEHPVGEHTTNQCMMDTRTQDHTQEAQLSAN